MPLTPVLAISIAVIIALFFLTIETIFELTRMDKKPREYTGSNRIAGTAE